MKKLIRYLPIILLVTLGAASVCYGKDFKGSLRSLQSEVEDILQVVGVISLLVAGGMFYFSKQKGFDQLTSAVIGTIIFGSASTIFSILIRVFA